MNSKALLQRVGILFALALIGGYRSVNAQRQIQAGYGYNGNCMIADGCFPYLGIPCTDQICYGCTGAQDHISCAYGGCLNGMATHRGSCP